MDVMLGIDRMAKIQIKRKENHKYKRCRKKKMKKKKTNKENTHCALR